MARPPFNQHETKCGLPETPTGEEGGFTCTKYGGYGLHSGTLVVCAFVDEYVCMKTGALLSLCRKRPTCVQVNVRVVLAGVSCLLTEFPLVKHIHAFLRLTSKHSTLK